MFVVRSSENLPCFAPGYHASLWRCLVFSSEIWIQVHSQHIAFHGEVMAHLRSKGMHLISYTFLGSRKCQHMPTAQ